MATVPTFSEDRCETTQLANDNTVLMVGERHKHHLLHKLVRQSILEARVITQDELDAIDRLSWQDAAAAARELDGATAPATVPPSSEAANLPSVLSSELSDDYILHGCLGTGGSANVYYADDKSTGQRVAVKHASRRPRLRWGRLCRTFEREALLLRRAAHPHVTGFIAHYQTPTSISLVLRLCPGGDCQQLLQRHGALAEPAALQIARQVGAALAHMHTLRLLHRDVKLENVLVQGMDASSQLPRVELCDFGHACSLEGCCAGPFKCVCEGVCVGSPSDGFTGTDGYAPPEVAHGTGWSSAADVWSMGVVLYMLLANEALRWKPAPPPPGAGDRDPAAPHDDVAGGGPAVGGTRSLSVSTRGVPDVSTKTSRAFAQVSTATKMAIKAVLKPEASDRADLRSFVLALPPAVAQAEHESAGAISPTNASQLRRAPMIRSYSLVDLPHATLNRGLGAASGASATGVAPPRSSEQTCLAERSDSETSTHASTISSQISSYAASPAAQPRGVPSAASLVPSPSCSSPRAAVPDPVHIDLPPAGAATLSLQ